jgi:hypothetical protein
MVSTGRAGTWSASATALSDRARDSEAFVRSQVRRPGGPATGWPCRADRCRPLEDPYDIVERGQGHDLSSGWLWAQNEVAA